MSSTNRRHDRASRRDNAVVDGILALRNLSNRSVDVGTEFLLSDDSSSFAESVHADGNDDLDVDDDMGDEPAYDEINDAVDGDGAEVLDEEMQNADVGDRSMFRSDSSNDAFRNGSADGDDNGAEHDAFLNGSADGGDNGAELSFGDDNDIGLGEDMGDVVNLENVESEEAPPSDNELNWDKSDDDDDDDDAATTSRRNFDTADIEWSRNVFNYKDADPATARPLADEVILAMNKLGIGRWAGQGLLDCFRRQVNLQRMHFPTVRTMERQIGRHMIFDRRFYCTTCLDLKMHLTNTDLCDGEKHPMQEVCVCRLGDQLERIFRKYAPQILSRNNFSNTSQW